MKKTLQIWTILRPINTGFSLISIKDIVMVGGYYLTDFRRQLSDYFHETVGRVAQCENHIGAFDKALNNAQFSDVPYGAFQNLI